MGNGMIGPKGRREGEQLHVSVIVADQGERGVSTPW